MNAFLEDLGTDRQERIQPLKEFVKCHLDSAEIVEIKNGIAVQFTFSNEKGEIFSTNILEPFNETSTPTQRRNNIDKLMHIYGAFINCPIVEVKVGEKQVKREIKSVFENIPSKKLEDIHNYLFPQFIPQWKQLEVTLKLVYIDKKYENNLVQFPLYPPFLHTQLSHKVEVEKWQWNDIYDFLTPQHSKPSGSTDRENTAGEAQTFNHGAEGGGVTF